MIPVTSTSELEGAGETVAAVTADRSAPAALQAKDITMVAKKATIAVIQFPTRIPLPVTVFTLCLKTTVPAGLSFQAP